VLSDPKQLVVFLQQLKLFLNFNHEQKQFKADDINHNKIVLTMRRNFETEIEKKKNKGQSYPYVDSSMSHVLFDQETSFHY